ncbi:cell division protein FtsX [Methylocapsa acidiphila]|uniref:cell division protein FtsX n=1 Tax=Methylocapsa acidiphila TaxID=133552 RepID=UPI000419314A|nr:ABC transporter permease [Methylocapsa acidiphila]
MSIFSGLLGRTRSLRLSRLGQDGTEIRPDKALVPAASIAGRALVTVVAIMTFLASLTAGGAIMIADASRGWQDQVAHEMTIQIRPTGGRDIEADADKAAQIARKTSGVAAVRPYTKVQSEALLEPWLGSNLDLSELPVPRLIVVALDPETRLDAAALQRRLAEAVPGATVDDHRLWIERLAIMAKTVVLAAAVIFALVLTAMFLAVAFATRGAMAGNREIIEILHFVGAADDYISRQFQRHFFRLGLRGGALGGGAAIVAFFAASTLSNWLRATPSGDQVDVMFGDFALGPNVYGAIILIAACIALVTGFVSRVIVFRHLRDLT